jgi:acetylglutamate kinase
VLANIHDSSSLISEIWEHELSDLQEKGIVVAGMSPKLHNGFDACRGGVQEVWIGKPDLINSLTKTGTQLRVKATKDPQS